MTEVALIAALRSGTATAAELARAADMIVAMQWRTDIESAPKDGSKIEVRGEGWSGDDWLIPEVAVVWWDEKDEGWRFCVYDDGHYGIWGVEADPTHWRPIG